HVTLKIFLPYRSTLPCRNRLHFVPHFTGQAIFQYSGYPIIMGVFGFDIIWRNGIFITILDGNDDETQLETSNRKIENKPKGAAYNARQSGWRRSRL
ncbi:MAG: hypothetical protein KAT54_02800, partial [Candidatus Marinimicrobia bacterium]|nr:hypothetical protein [Candidatus Neomarinimicrobiota bacterium]